MAVARVAVVLLLTACIFSVTALPKYMDELPNLPVVNGQVVRGVGHIDPKGAGELNPFGKDFAKNGHKWTVALCRMDSDGDGVTNGRELGDPDCKWSKGAARPAGPASHPGRA